MELVHRRVAVLVAGGSPVALPAKAATSDIPVIFMVGLDPVEIGLVASLNHPGGNLTGVSYLNAEVAPKRLELLHELVPTARSIALLVNTANPVAAGAEAKALQAVVSALGLHLLVVNASNALQIEDAFAALYRIGSRRFRSVSILCSATTSTNSWLSPPAARYRRSTRGANSRWPAVS